MKMKRLYLRFILCLTVLLLPVRSFADSRDAAGSFARSLEEKGIDVLFEEDGFGIRLENSDTLSSCNVIGYIQGFDDVLKNNFIVIGAPLEDPEALRSLLYVAGMLSTNRFLLDRSVLVAAFGSTSADAAGSWYFLNRSFPEKERIDAMIELRHLGGNGPFVAFTSSNRDMNHILESVSSTLQPVKPAITSKEPFMGDHRSFYNSGIPSVLFTNGESGDMFPSEDEMLRQYEYIHNFTVSLCSAAKPSFDAQDTAAPEDDTVPYYRCDIPPAFLGSTDMAFFLRKWVYVYLKYPKEALEKGVSGRVRVDFTIDKKGKVRDVVAAKSTSPLLEDAAVKVVEASPDWKPARHHGAKVDCSVSLWIDFRLERK